MIPGLLERWFLSYSLRRNLSVYSCSVYPKGRRMSSIHKIFSSDKIPSSGMIRCTFRNISFRPFPSRKQQGAPQARKTLRGHGTLPVCTSLHPKVLLEKASPPSQSFQGPHEAFKNASAPPEFFLSFQGSKSRKHKIRKGETFQIGGFRIGGKVPAGSVENGFLHLVAGHTPVAVGPGIPCGLHQIIVHI